MNYGEYLGYITPPIRKGQAGGVAELNSNGKIPADRLPSYVDQIIEYDTFDNFPSQGTDGKIYFDKENRQCYRWTGSQYVFTGNFDIITRSSGEKSVSINGSDNLASGTYSYAEGFASTASGIYAHAEGQKGQASGNGSHVQGGLNIASGNMAHAEGVYTKAIGTASHAEGNKTSAEGNFSHAEGYLCVVSGNYSHAEGSSSTASGIYSHAQGYQTLASEPSSHAQNYRTKATAQGSHAQGYGTIASAAASHAQGYATEANHRSQHVSGQFNIIDSSTVGPDSRGEYVQIIGNGTADNARSNARTLDWDGNQVLSGKLTVGTGPSQDMDVTTKQYVDTNYVQFTDYANSNTPGVVKIGNGTGVGLNSNNQLSISAARASDIKEGTNTYKPIIPASIHTTTFYGLAKAAGDSTQSASTLSVGTYTDQAKTAIQTMLNVPSLDMISKGTGDYSIKINDIAGNVASGTYSYAEGCASTASGYVSHTEGQSTLASGQKSHAEGNGSHALGAVSHAEGSFTEAIGSLSHTEGFSTKATHLAQHVFGRNNIADPSSNPPTTFGNYVEIVGNGENSPSNARTLDWNGNESLAGNLTLGLGTKDQVTISPTQLKQLLALLN